MFTTWKVNKIKYQKIMAKIKNPKVCLKDSNAISCCKHNCKTTTTTTTIFNSTI